MELVVKNLNNKAVNNMALADATFGLPFNESLVHQVVTAYQAAARQGTKAQKTRSEVSGGGVKPWKQKGTGRARAGTIRSPLWRKGGVIFAARPRDFAQKVNRKMYRAAIKSILSELIRNSRLHVVDALQMDSPKTKNLVQTLSALNLKDVLIIVNEVSENLFLASRNLYHVSVRDVESIDPVSLIAYENVLVTSDALKKMEESLA